VTSPRLRLLSAALAASLVLTACGASLPDLGLGLPSNARPVAEPGPTASPPATTPVPVVDGSPSIVLEPPEFVVTATPTRISLPLPQERISLDAPGPGSQVVSPVRVSGWAGPAYGGRIFVRLIGEQGQEIARATTYLLAIEGSAGLFVVTVPFTLQGVAEAGMIEVSFNHPTTNQVVHIHSRPVVFLSTGPALIHPDPGAPEKVTIFTPRDERRVSGGVAHVRGGAWLDEDLPLLIEVLDRDGNVVGSTEVEVQAPVLGELGTFEADVPFTIPNSQYGRIAVIERSLSPPGVRHFTSVRVYLEP
jgi:hypothetical protein